MFSNTVTLNRKHFFRIHLKFYNKSGADYIWWITYQLDRTYQLEFSDINVSKFLTDRIW